MPLFKDDVKKQLSEMLGQMQNNVNIVYFTQKMECGTCQDTHSFLDEFSSLSPKLNLTVHSFDDHKDRADSLGIDKIPAIILLDKDNNNHGIYFYGLPGGYEINSFLKAILEVSGQKEEFPPQLQERVSKISKDIHIQIFVTLVCPYCPTAVMSAHRLALESAHIRADMVESSTFPQLAIKHSVNTVPKIIINDTEEIAGAVSVENILEVIEKM